MWQFAWEVEDHFEPGEYGPAWRRLAHRVVGLLDEDPDSRLTAGLTWASWSRPPRSSTRA